MDFAPQCQMKLGLRNIILRLGEFTLELNVEIDRATTAVFGPSGAGKTSLLDLVAGLRRAESGQIELNGKILTNVPTRLRGIGYVPQDLALFPHMNVRRNLLYGCRDEAFDHVVHTLEIESLLERSVANLSGGEKQRVTLARALLAAPQLLLLDEPLSSLDVGLKRRLIPYLQRIRDELRVPMLYVTHDPDEVAELCEEVLVLEKGRCVARGTPAEIFERTTEPRYRLRP
jgi:molybdate transport system ATP-binding protein